MFRRVVLVLMFALTMVAALPASTSAGSDPEQAQGGRNCYTYESTGGLGEGCSMGSNRGGRTDHELYNGWYHETRSGGGGEGGGGSRDSRTYLSTGQQECDIGS